LKPIAVKELAAALRRTIYNAYCATLVGSPAAITEAYSERARDPRIGDMVIESTTIHHPRHDLNGVGILEKIVQEPVDYGADFIWDEETEGRPHPTERVFYLRTLDGALARWTNANMVAAVSDMATLSNDTLLARKKF
jgi:hypothetical protein